MPISYEIRPEAIWFRTVGDVDYQKGIAVLEAAVEAARRRGEDRRWPVVFDILDSEERRSADELRGVAHFVASHGDVLAPHCAVIAGDDFHFGLARMFESLADGHDVRVTVLRRLDDVPEWLAVVADGLA